MNNSEKIRFEDMPFYKSMMRVQSSSQIDPLRLLLWQFGFKATPASCACGHDWSAYDLMLEAVGSGHHDWQFYRNYSIEPTVPQTFRSAAIESLTCPDCKRRSQPIQVLYNYATQCCPNGKPV